MTRRNCYLGIGIASLLIGTVSIIIGGVIPHVFLQRFHDTMLSNTILQGERLNRFVKQGYSYGGTVPDTEDNAELIDYYLVSFTNLPDVLVSSSLPPTTTVPPQIIEYGPIAYRRYVTTDDQCTAWPGITCGVSADGTTQTGYERPTIILDQNRTDLRLRNHATGSVWDTTYLTIPNIEYRAFETNMVALSNGLANSFDDIAIPLFTSNFFRTYIPLLRTSLRALLVPIALQEIVNEAVNTVKIMNSYTLHQAYDDIALGFLSNRVNMGVLTLGIDLSLNNLFQMSTAVAHRLLNASNVISPLNMQGWYLWFNTIQEYNQQQNSNIGPATQLIMDTFLSEFRSIDTLYIDPNDPTQPSTKALYHINLILAWLNTFVNTTTTPHTIAMESNIATALFRIGMIPTNDWDKVIYAQLGSNQILGSIPDLFKVPNASASTDTRTGLSVRNTCPGTVSLYGGAGFQDVPYIAAQLPSDHHIELTCWNNREFFLPNASLTNTSTVTQTSFGTHLSPLDMHKVIHYFTIGTGMLSVYTNDTYFQGTYNIALFLQGLRLLQRDLDNNTIIAQHHVYSAATAYANVVTGLWSLNQYTAVMQSLGTCPSRYDPLNLQLPCAALLDIRQWLIHIGKSLVWHPLFVEHGPVIYDNISNTFIIHTDPYFANLAHENNPRRAGPFIRCTVREIMEYGCHDNWLDYFRTRMEKKSPGDTASRVAAIGPVDYSSPAKDPQWNTYKQNRKPDTRYTGKDDIRKVDIVQRVEAEPNITLWKGYRDDTASLSNPVDGAYTVSQFSPYLSLPATNSYNQEDIPVSIDVWSREGLRSIPYTYTMNGKDPYDNLYTWTYRLGPSVSTTDAWTSIISPMKTDTEDTTPVCAMNIGKRMNNAPVYLSTPYFTGCPLRSLPHHIPIPGYVYNDNRTRSEERLGSYINIEPISGKVTDTHQRYGIHLRWEGSVWYPSLRLTYGLVYWIDRHHTIKETDSQQLSTLIKDTRYLFHLLIPVIFFTVGSIVLLFGVYMTRKGYRTPVSLLFTDPRNVPGNTQPKDDLD